MSSVANVERRVRGKTPGRRLRLVPTSWRGLEEETIELRLSFHELVLVHKSLQAVKILDGLGSQDELLDDTTRLVDLALKRAL
jgi:hypothetical protein